MTSLASASAVKDIDGAEPAGLASAVELANAELKLVFPKPIMVFRWPDSAELNEQLAKVILAAGPGGRRSNVGGWQSSYSFADWPEPAVKALLRRAQAMLRELIVRTVPNADERHFSGWKMEAWANVCGHGHYNSPHDHTMHGVSWSGIYYVATEENAGGVTQFHDESGVPKEMILDGDMFSREVSVPPRAGQMVMFPGPLHHYVFPYLGHSQRISVAFNFRHPQFVIPSYRSDSFMLRNFRGVVRARELIAIRLRRVIRRIFPASLKPNTAWQQYYTSDHPLRRKT